MKNYQKYHIFNIILHVYLNYFYFHFRRGKKTLMTIGLTNLDFGFSVER